jgi:hypothetical protein
VIGVIAILVLALPRPRTELVDLPAQGPLSPEAEASHGALRAELEALF